MAKFFDNVTGRQKLVGMFGLIIIALLALRFIPTETGTLMTWVEDMVHHFLEFVQGEGP